MTRVVNVKGTSDLKPEGYPNWLEYWEAKKWRKATHCYACGKKEDLVGAHVQYAQNAQICDKTVYIVPLCKGCNSNPDPFEIEGSEDFVVA